MFSLSGHGLRGLSPRRLRARRGPGGGALVPGANDGSTSKNGTTVRLGEMILEIGWKKPRKMGKKQEKNGEFDMI